MSDEQQILDDSDLRKYRTEIPNMADDDLDPFRYRLYAHYKRVGNCYESVRTTAKKTQMSVGQVVDTRNWLHDNGWITVEDQDNHPTLLIKVVDRWVENFARYAPVHGVNKAFTTRTHRSSGEPKNIPNKKEPQEEEGEHPAAIFWRENMKCLLTSLKELEEFKYLMEVYSKDRLLAGMDTARARDKYSVAYLRGILNGEESEAAAKAASKQAAPREDDPRRFKEFKID